MKFQNWICVAGLLLASATSTNAQTATKGDQKAAAPTGSGSAIVAIAPCLPIEDLVGQFPKEMKQNVDLIVDGNTVATIQSCNVRTIPVRAGQHSFRASNFPKILPIPDPVYTVPSGGKLYIIVKIGNPVEHRQVSADEAKRAIAVLSKK